MISWPFYWWSSAQLSKQFGNSASFNRGRKAADWRALFQHPLFARTWKKMKLHKSECHKPLADTILKLQADILQQLLPDLGTAPAVVIVRSLPYKCMHSVAAVEIGKNGSS